MLRLFTCSIDRQGLFIQIQLTKTSTMSALDVAPGQFDDALEDDEQYDPRQGGYYIDDVQLLEWSEPSEDDDGDYASGDDRVEDQDWEIAERGESASITS